MSLKALDNKEQFLFSWQQNPALQRQAPALSVSSPRPSSVSLGRFAFTIVPFPSSGGSPLSVSNHVHFCCCFISMFLSLAITFLSPPLPPSPPLSFAPNPPKHTGLGGVRSSQTRDSHLSRKHGPPISVIRSSVTGSAGAQRRQQDKGRQVPFQRVSLGGDGASGPGRACGSQALWLTCSFPRGRESSPRRCLPRPARVRALLPAKPAAGPRAAARIGERLHGKRAPGSVEEGGRLGSPFITEAAVSNVFHTVIRRGCRVAREGIASPEVTLGGRLHVTA